MWYIGQEVVCIDDSTKINVNVKEGKIYIVDSVQASSCCRREVLELRGLNQTTNIRCRKCGSIKTKREHYLSSRFVPLDSLMKEEIEELMKVETIFGVKI